MREMFGNNSIIDHTDIDYVINMMAMDGNSQFERLGRDIEKVLILGKDIPKIDVPVSSARNIASLVEVAVNQMKLRERGVDAFKTLENRIKINNTREDD